MFRRVWFEGWRFRGVVLVGVLEVGGLRLFFFYEFSFFFVCRLRI